MTDAAPSCREAGDELNLVDPGFCPDDDAPAPIRLGRGCVLAAADRASVQTWRHGRINHLRYTSPSGHQSRFRAYLGSSIDVGTADGLALALELERQLRRRHRLQYVVKPRVLNKDRNHAYIFASSGGRPRIAVVAESMWAPMDDKGGLVRLHQPWVPRPPGAPSEPPCDDCGELHIRVLVTFFRLEGKKARFVQGTGLSIDQRLFDPGTHCELYTALPDSWDVEAAGGEVRVSATGPDRRRTWRDDKLAYALPGGPVKVARLPDDVVERLAAGYASADEGPHGPTGEGGVAR